MGSDRQDEVDQLIEERRWCRALWRRMIVSGPCWVMACLLLVKSWNLTFGIRKDPYVRHDMAFESACLAFAILPLLACLAYTYAFWTPTQSGMSDRDQRMTVAYRWIGLLTVFTFGGMWAGFALNVGMEALAPEVIWRDYVDHMKEGVGRWVYFWGIGYLGSLCLLVIFHIEQMWVTHRNLEMAFNHLGVKAVAATGVMLVWGIIACFVLSLIIPDGKIFLYVIMLMAVGILVLILLLLFPLCAMLQGLKAYRWVGEIEKEIEALGMQESDA